MKPVVDILSKFRGGIQGVLVGDCFGATYEGELLTKSDKKVFKKCLDKLEEKYVKSPARKFTDDTAMTRALLSSIIEHKSFNQFEVAKEFTTEYFREPHRGYGNAVGVIFRKLKGGNFLDILSPARDQFDGLGSYGNGAAMRVCPVALLTVNKPIETVLQMAREQSVITHTHPLAISGAVLQALAIRQALHLDPNEPLNVEWFLNALNEEIIKVDDENKSYQTQIEEIRKLINAEHSPSDDRVVDILGHNIAALYSVPTAIYCFLRSEQEGDRKPAGIDSENPFRRCLEYSIGLGGDTDTIASMACSISGAYRGEAVVPENLLKCCEGYESLTQMAGQLCQLSQV